ncbi:MAG: hypothetical protein RL594_478 [Bacteroidota bacterium]|jgi:FKBP-type peptidyl-prolyl cis-trans isomerase FklB
MNSRIIFITAIAAFLVTSSLGTFAQTTKLMTPKDTASYAIGLQIGKSLKDQGLDIDIPTLSAGMADYFAGAPKLTPDQIQTVMMDLQKKAMERMQAEQAKKGDENAKKGEAFLAENKKDPNVKVTASGLQYKVVKEGTGKKPTRDNVVKVHYTGKLIDGTVFDSSVERGEPTEFPLGNVIAGWTEGVQLMSVGSKFTFFIPPTLAYGANGAGQSIGPNETLIFEVELLDIVK